MATANDRIFWSTPIRRYVQQAELIRQRVAKGHCPAGSLLSCIEPLMTEFDVARVTVRQALALLADENILSPQVGRGTCITENPVTRRRLRVETPLDGLVAIYSGHKPAHATLAKAMGNPMLTERRHRRAERLLSKAACIPAMANAIASVPSLSIAVFPPRG
jgi:GntR family transcriptional regulator